MQKKLLAVAIAACLVVLILPFSEGFSEGVTEEHIEHTVTFAKYLPDGTMEHVEQTIGVASDESLSTAIAQRCAALMKDDVRFQYLIEQQAGLYLIISGGDGFHVALPPALMEIRLLRISFNLIPSIIYCSYSDSEATTTVTPLAGDGEVTSYDGPHKILAGGFVGVIGWSGVFSFASTGFAGLTLFIWTPGTST